MEQFLRSTARNCIIIKLKLISSPSVEHIE